MPKWRKLPPHPFADVFPRLSQDELREMAASIRTHGLLKKITVYEGKVLDGINRQDACELAGVEPAYEDFAGKDPLAFVLAVNLNRRHMDESRRAIAAAKLCQVMPEGSQNVRWEKAALLFNVSVASVWKAHRVVTKAVPAVKELVVKGELSVNAASEVVALPEVKQKSLAAKGAKAVRDQSQVMKREKKEKKVEVAEEHGENPFSPAPKRPEHALAVREALAAINHASALLTRLIRLPDGERFAEYIGEMGLGWIDYTRQKVRDADGSGRLEDVPAPFRAFAAVRQLLAMSSRERRYSLARLHAAVRHADHPDTPFDPAAVPPADCGDE